MGHETAHLAVTKWNYDPTQRRPNMVYTSFISQREKSTVWIPAGVLLFKLEPLV